MWRLITAAPSKAKKALTAGSGGESGGLVSKVGVVGWVGSYLARGGAGTGVVLIRYTDQPGHTIHSRGRERCSSTHSSLAEIQVLAGDTILPAPAVPTSTAVTSISARLKRVQEHNSPMNITAQAAHVCA